jgi:protease-4
MATGTGEKERLTAWGVLKTAFKVVVGLSLLVQSLLFIVLLLAIIGIAGGISASMKGQDDPGSLVKVEEGAALLLNPKGVLSEQAPAVDPFEEALSEALGGGGPSQVSVHDLVATVRAAKDDERIEALVLDLGGLYVPSIYASKAYYLADAIEEFRESGKRVIAISDRYTQEQYLIASEADTVLVHDYGEVFILGYGSYRTYFAEALARLKVTSHVFRVGTFKSALEPYLRDDMSPAAELANKAYLDVLWAAYAERVEANRGLPEGRVNRLAQDMPALLAAAGGDLARLAERAGLVDEVMGRAEQTAFVAAIVGEEEEEDAEVGFRHVAWSDYRNTIDKDLDRDDFGNVAVVTVSGAIVDGDVGGSDVAAGDLIADELRRAREDDDVKALVLRVDSPGGSAFASEVIRDEVLAIKAAGKPVVVSMGSLAASGGYWISAPADAIYAVPTTLTGSIGIFGYLPTLENTLREIGVNTDGVGTTPLAALTNAGLGPLPEDASELFQLSIENGYDRFLAVVAEGRGMSREAVDNVGQGRVWIGLTAKTINLVDQLGDYDEAVAGAAALAGLEDYDVVRMTDAKSPFELFIENLTGSAAEVGLAEPQRQRLFGSVSERPGTIRQLTDAVRKEAAFQATFNDPNGAYVRCLECEVK